MMKSPLLTVTDLSFTHVGRSQPTIANIYLALHPGEIVLIAGATGSGKSTLLNCIAGISPTHTGGQLTGEIQFNGESILTWSVQRRSQILGTVLQNVETQIFTDRVIEELAFGLENLNLPPAQITTLSDAALQEFDLEPQRYWSIHQLSAGQKQRLILACVLAMNQPIVLLDEPFAYLDQASATYLLQLLQQRATRGQTILLVEHRLDLVRGMCDRIYYFAEGHLVERSRESGVGSRELGVGSWELGVGSRESGVGSRESRIKRKLEDVGKESYSALSTQHSALLPSPNSTPRVLVMQNLSWGGYPAFPDLEVERGETILLKGDNGCGKTTFLKVICGLLQPATGSVEILGRNTRRKRVVTLAKVIGFVLQNPNHQLFGESVQQEVLQPGITVDAATQMLERLQLSDRADQHPQSLSQGQKRRLALGAVLVRQPQICLLDEITVGQDPTSLTLMLDVLQDFTQQGGTLILTSHDPQVARSLDARIVQFGVNR